MSSSLDGIQMIFFCLSDSQTQAHFHEISCEQNVNSIDRNYNNFSLSIFILTISFIKNLVYNYNYKYRICKVEIHSTILQPF